MPRVGFTPHLARHLTAPAASVEGSTVREVLEAVFNTNPALRTYILDEQGRLRRHVVIFIDGDLVGDRIGLGDPVGPSSDVFVMQALSGG